MGLGLVSLLRIKKILYARNHVSNWKDKALICTLADLLLRSNSPHRVLITAAPYFRGRLETSAVRRAWSNNDSNRAISLPSY